ncbi:MAG: hypothetical protein ABI678_05380 [Kofleriaceae bacterium]
MTRFCWVLGLLAGCSFALSGPDPKAPRTQSPHCDREKTAVVIDSVLGAAAGVATLAVGADNGGAAVIPALLGAVFVGAAIHGNTVVNDCREADAEYLATLQSAPPPPAVVEDRRYEAAEVTSPVALVPPAPAAPAEQTPPPPAATAPDAWAEFWKEVQ